MTTVTVYQSVEVDVDLCKIGAQDLRDELASRGNERTETPADELWDDDRWLAMRVAFATNDNAAVIRIARELCEERSGIIIP